MLGFKLSDGYVGSCSFGGTGVKAYRALGGALQWGIANIINHINVQSFLLDQGPQPLQDIPKSEDNPELPKYSTDGKIK